MKILVTHINPHLDDIAAIWLYKKFQNGWKEAKVDFISQTKGNKSLEENDDLVYIGVGRGKFDEHKGDLGDCSTSLIWKYFKKIGILPKDELLIKALDELVEWVRLGDLGRLPEEKYGDFSLPAFIRPTDSTILGSKKAVELGGEILERILAVLKKNQQSLQDWQGRVEFKSSFGRSFAIKSHSINRGFCNKMAGELFLMYDPKYGSVQFYTPSQKIDLEPIYQKIKQLRPQEQWYLHQSHHMVLCGSSSAPDVKPTTLSWEELIEVAKSV